MGDDGAERGPGLVRDRRGAVTVEYVILVALVGVVGSFAILSLGLPLLRAFRYAQYLISIPVP